MLELNGIRKTYITGTTSVEALKGIDLKFRDSEFVSILGQSGCGKTTLLNIIGGLDKYTSGDLKINGRSTKDFKDRDWDAYRNNSIGFVFQSYNLIPHQTLLANVELALTISGVGKAERRRRAKEALENGISMVHQELNLVLQRSVMDNMWLGRYPTKGMFVDQDKMYRDTKAIFDELDIDIDPRARVGTLSVSQMQMIEIAKAFSYDAKIVIMDEPTVGLDPAQMIEIRSLIHDLGKTHTVILSSHILSEVQTVCDRVLIIAHGKLVAQGTPEELAGKLAARGTISATAQGGREAVLAAAATVPGLTDLRVTAEKGGEVSFTAVSESGADLRGALSLALAKADCPVLNLSAESMSLEDVFLQLTETPENQETNEEEAE